jgi:8-oxo-dGTP pyrophosphatase MutT (NUDIX family)
VDEPAGPVARECVEGYLFSTGPLRILILRRPPERGEFWVPVSGKVDPTDASWEAAIRREVGEETGLTDPRRVFALDWHVRFRADNGETWRLHAYGVETEPEFTPRLSPEHEAAEWVTPAEAVGRLHFEDNRAAVARLLERLGPTSPKV